MATVDFQQILAAARQLSKSSQATLVSALLQEPEAAHTPAVEPLTVGVVNHCNTVVEPPEHVAQLIRQALEYIPPEQLVITTDCGFGREGLSRRIVYYKCVSLIEGTNIVRRELGLPEARVRAADPTLYFASGAE